MDYEAHKRKTLAHCLQFVETDPDYALWAAGEYERTAPWLLTNLRRKVAQAVERSRASAPAADSAQGGSGPV